MFWQLLLAAAVIGAAYYRWSRRKLYRLAEEVAALPKCYPIIGHAPMFLGSSEDRMMALQKLGLTANLRNGFCSMWLVNRLYICVTDPASIEVVSKACLAKDEFTLKFVRTAIGNGSIFAPVKIWQPRRKINAPFFKPKNLQKLVPFFEKQSSTMVKLMQKELGREFSIWKYFTTFTFDSILESAIGVEINSQKDPDHYLLRAIDDITQMISKRMLQPWLHPNFIYENLPVYGQFQQHMKRVNTFTQQVIQNRRTEFAAKKSNNNKNEINETTNFIDFAIQSSGGLERGYSDEELREEVVVLGVAGSDTSATGVSFTAVLLARHPAVQDKVHQELQEVFGDSDRAVTAEDLPRLQYLEAVIKESLRLYPPVPIIARQVDNDVVLPSGTRLVAGVAVMMNIWGMHRSRAWWGADAELFRPERFLEGSLRHPAQFVPFGYSVRNCIGGTYAMLSAKTVLANMLRRYRVLPPAGARAADLARPLPVKWDIMMKAVDGFIVRIEENNKTL